MGAREAHRKVMKAMKSLAKDSKFMCINVEEIAKTAKVDARTAKAHLGILEEHGYGKFCDEKGRTFMPAKK